MERKSFGDMNCSVAQTLEVVGEWWSMLIVRDAFLGVRRFDDFQSRLGISRNVLTNRLDHLIAHGVLERVPYQDRPVRCEYRLTPKGRDLWPVLNALRDWGDRWAAPDGPPLVLDHRGRGHQAVPTTVCSVCGEPLDSSAVMARPGPGYNATRRPALPAPAAN
ncbi:MAG: winged helix-turn-helix transcriptional regulator [Acidimicrobiales bacterium]